MIDPERSTSGENATQMVELSDVFSRAIKQDESAAIYFNSDSTGLDGDSTMRNLGRQALKHALDSFTLDDATRKEIAQKIDVL